MKRVMIVTIISGVLMAWCGFAVYGMIQFYIASERAEMIEGWKAKTIDLELKVEKYERLIPTLPVLRQLLTPVPWLELEALSERNRQEKVRNAEE